MNKMKIPAAYAAAVAVIILVIVAACSYQGVEADDQLSNQDFIRLHVVANSDTEGDQALKLKVRDKVIEFVNEELVREAVERDDGKEGMVGFSVEESRQFITANLDDIVDVAQQVVAEEGYEYNVTAEFGVSWIPQKSYGSVIFPAGNYEALKIMIGEASGRNWWCVIYPPLCLIDTGEDYKDQDKMRDMIMQGKYEQLAETSENGGKTTVLKLKFKTLELIKIFSD